MPLPFPDVPALEASVWDALKNDQRTVVIEVLARLFVKAAAADAAPEEPRDE